jgi:hypothetical protein
MSFKAWPDVDANSYLSVADADDYLSLSIHASEWNDSTTTTKQQALVSATRMLDRQNWEGEKTSSSQSLEWPRTNAYDRDGNLVSSSTIPQQILDATAEHALVFVKDAEAADSSDQGSLQSIKTEETTVTFANLSKPKQFNKTIRDLISPFLDISGIAATANYGEDEESQFEDEDHYDRSEGLA